MSVCKSFITRFAMLLALAVLLPSALAQTTVTFAFWGGQEEFDLTQKLADQFQAENPDIKINLQQIDSNTYEQKLLVQIASQTAPDVMVIRDASSSFLARRGIYADLTPLIESSTMDTSVFEAQTLANYSLDGVQYGLPRSVTPVVMYYNKTMFDAAGVEYPTESWTWEDFTAAAKALTKDNDGDGATDQWGTFMVPWDALFLPIVYTYGGNLLSEDGTTSTLLQPETVAAFQYATDLILTEKVAPPVDEAEAFGWIDGWAQQKYAMIFQGRWATPIFNDAMEKAGSDFVYDVSSVPQGAERKTIQYSDALGISATSQNKEAAFKWIMYLTGDEGMAVLGGPDSLVVPANLKAAESLVVPETMPANAQLFLTEAKYGFPPPQTPSFSAYYEILNRNLREVFLGLKSVEEGLTTADEELNEMLKTSYESLE
jgi:multiple sugar transport system substrate-binding protein